MNTLETIRKTLGVFKIIAKVAYILCIVGAVTFGTGALIAVSQNNGGHVFSIFGEPIEIFPDGTNLAQKFVELLSISLTLAAQAILLVFTHAYLKAEQTDGTPFTESGANKLKTLGIRFIYIPLIATAISEIIATIQGVENIGIIDDFSSVITGIVLLLVSLVFRYGAEIERDKRAKNTPDNPQ